MPSHCSAHPSIEGHCSESPGNGQGRLVAIPRDESIWVQLFQNRDVQYIGCSALQRGGMSRTDLSGISQCELPLNFFFFERALHEKVLEKPPQAFRVFSRRPRLAQAKAAHGINR